MAEKKRALQLDPQGPAPGETEAGRRAVGTVETYGGPVRLRRARRPLALARQPVWPSPSVHRVGARKEVFRGSLAGPLPFLRRKVANEYWG